MKKKKFILILIIVILILVFPIRRFYDNGKTLTYSSLLYKVIIWDKGDDSEVTDIYFLPNNFHKMEYYVIVEEDYLLMYEKIIDSIYSTSAIMNKDIEYIALDLDSFKYLEYNDRQKLIDYAKKYCDKVMDATYEKSEVNNDENYLNGIFLRAEDAKRENKIITLKMIKYRTNLGSVINEYKAEYEQSVWNVVITSFSLN